MSIKNKNIVTIKLNALTDLSWLKFSTVPHDPEYPPAVNDWIVVTQEQYDELRYTDNVEEFTNEDGTFLIVCTLPENKDKKAMKKWRKQTKS